MTPIGRERLVRGGAAAVTALCAVAVGVGLDGAGPTHQVLAGVFALGAPALAIASCWPTRELLGRVALGVSGAMAVVILVSQALLLAGTSSRQAGVIAIGVISALVWLGAPQPDPRRERSGGGARNVRPAAIQDGAR